MKSISEDIIQKAQPDPYSDNNVKSWIIVAEHQFNQIQS